MLRHPHINRELVTSALGAQERAAPVLPDQLATRGFLKINRRVDILASLRHIPQRALGQRQIVQHLQLSAAIPRRPKLHKRSLKQFQPAGRLAARDIGRGELRSGQCLLPAIAYLLPEHEGMLVSVDRLPHPAAARVDAPQPCQRIGFQGLETLAARNLHGRLRGLPRLWHPAHLLEYPGESPQREDLKHRANFAIVPEGLRRQLHSTLELPEHPVIDHQVSEHRVLTYPVPKSTQNLDGFSFFLNSFLDATRTTEQPSHVGYRTGFGVAISRLVRDRARFIAVRAGLLDIPELILKLLHVQQALGLLHPVSSLMPECSLLVDNQDSLASALLGLCLLLLRGFIVESLGLQALLVQGFCCPQLLEHDGVTQGDPAAGRDNLDPILARRL